MVEWLIFLLHIREVPGLNLGQNTGYLDRELSWLSPVTPGKRWDITLKLGHLRFFHIL
jgi:hypothetical protein